MHVVCEPAILYLGTPVVLISTLNEDGSPNLAPMSSAFWLGWRCMLGLASSSQTSINLKPLKRVGKKESSKAGKCDGSLQMDVDA
jgi:flavin reductase (DIM6/NTAB) family NADH-FMN oxidoreductase RutF